MSNKKVNPPKDLIIRARVCACADEQGVKTLDVERVGGLVVAYCSTCVDLMIPDRVIYEETRTDGPTD